MTVPRFLLPHANGAALTLTVFLSVSAQAQTDPFESPQYFPIAVESTYSTFCDANSDGAAESIFGRDPGLRCASHWEDGTVITSFNGSQDPSQSAGYGSPVALASGLLDGDDRPDVVTMQPLGSILWHKNLGSTEIDRVRFDSGVNVVPLSHPPNPAAQTTPGQDPEAYPYRAAFLEVGHFNGDTHSDIVVAAAEMGPTTLPGFFRVYVGDGAGGFMPSAAFDLMGNVIDGEFADLDGDGDRDHFVIVTETSIVGSSAFDYHVYHFNFDASGVVQQVGPPQLIPPTGGKITALEFSNVSDISANLYKDYIFSVTIGDPSADFTSHLIYYQGNGAQSGAPAFDPNISGTTVGLPPPFPSVVGHIYSFQVADVDLDGHDDLIFLKGNTALSSGPGQPVPVHSVSEVFVMLGVQGQSLFSALPAAPLVKKTLPAYYRNDASEDAYTWAKPLFSEPDALQLVAFAMGAPDLAIASGHGGIMTMKNHTSVPVGQTEVNSVGYPSGSSFSYPGPGPESPGSPGVDSSLPIKGGYVGKPVLGSVSKGTVSNGPAGAICTLVWGPLAQEFVTWLYGCHFHVAYVHSGLTTFTDATGRAEHPILIPNIPALLGQKGAIEWMLYGPSGFATSQALELTIGSP